MDYSGRKILVTGGAGFIGSELVRQAAAQGAEVLAVDNLVNGKRQNLEDVLSDNVQLLAADIRDEIAMETALEGVDIVFHLACLGVRHSIHAPFENHQVNAEATLKLLALARQKEIKRFVYVSSSEVYGTARSVPMPELHPAFPHTVYGSSKLAGECYTRAFYDTYGFETVVVRPFNAYGPRCHHEGDSGEVIPKFMLRAMAGEPLVVFGDGTQTRDFTFVGDTARGILLAGSSAGAAGQTINLGSGYEISINELADKVSKVVGRQTKIAHDHPRPGDVLRLFADSSKAEKLLSFSPQISLEEGLKRLKVWYENSAQPVAELLKEEKLHNWKTDEPPKEGVSATIPIIKPWMGQAEYEAVKRPIYSGWVTQGPEVQAFEKEFLDYTGAEYACAVSSCTTGLHLALLAAGVQPGDEVITVSHSFIATTNSIRYCGAVPVFVDIQPETFNIAPVLIEKVITPKTRAILCVHQMGMPCDLTEILKIAGKHSLPVIEDAACAAGSEILWDGTWQKIGKPQGDAACFSFHPRKVITTGDGGMITTRHAEWDRRFRSLRHNGMGISDAVRHHSEKVIFESYDEMGFNYRMTDIQAALGRQQLKRLPEIVKRRRKLAERYQHLLKAIGGVQTPEEPAWARSNWQSYCIRLTSGLNQKDVMQQMLDQQIATRRGIMCAHREPAYEGEDWVKKNKGTLNESEKAQDQCILLPLYPQMTFEEQDCVTGALKNILSAVRL